MFVTQIADGLLFSRGRFGRAGSVLHAESSGAGAACSTESPPRGVDPAPPHPSPTAVQKGTQRQVSSLTVFDFISKNTRCSLSVPVWQLEHSLPLVCENSHDFVRDESAKQTFEKNWQKRFGPNDFFPRSRPEPSRRLVPVSSMFRRLERAAASGAGGGRTSPPPSSEERGAAVGPQRPRRILRASQCECWKHEAEHSLPAFALQCLISVVFRTDSKAGV